MTNSYKELVVWQKSIELADLIYRVTKEFPEYELYGLVSQMRRCAVSIPSNIAEGKGRGTAKDFKNFLQISQGSAYELETQLLISKNNKYYSDADYQKINDLLTEILKMLTALIIKLRE